MTPRAQPLVIAVGNRLRGDDGAAIWLAERLLQSSADRLPYPGQVIACHQLSPELADAIAAARAVLFVDASLTEGCGQDQQPLLLPLPARADSTALSHCFTPAQLLALSQALHGVCPPAWQLLIPGSDWRLGEQLSKRTTAACDAALLLLQDWGRRHA